MGTFSKDLQQSRCSKESFILFGVRIDLDESTKNHTLWGDDENTSIYIRDPSPEVDAAWNHISADASPIITVNSEEAIRLGRDPNVIVKAPEDWGGGTITFVLDLETQPMPTISMFAIRDIASG
ncbi:hypothetical protein M7I_7764 [Glarea lozoyensis 74030]|uniref:Uncharacterized protein n=1 Tax=Glarea lozoyensis (strain ATCC 74030 / MF5533) TaxID=1104152 RepID=H0EY67_GLAL7|nr:hypothetical protein M7I_7764 [Glarea lozoyensis 74030]